MKERKEGKVKVKAQAKAPKPPKIKRIAAKAGKVRSRVATHKQAPRSDAASTLERTPSFREACELAGVEPTRRQACKCMRHEGAAWLALLPEHAHKAPAAALPRRLGKHLGTQFARA